MRLDEPPASRALVDYRSLIELTSQAVAQRMGLVTPKLTGSALYLRVAGDSASPITYFTKLWNPDGGLGCDVDHHSIHYWQWPLEWAEGYCLVDSASGIQVWLTNTSNAEEFTTSCFEDYVSEEGDGFSDYLDSNGKADDIDESSLAQIAIAKRITS